MAQTRTKKDIVKMLLKNKELENEDEEQLMEIFNREVNDYDELITKRREINDILKYIKDKDFLDILLKRGLSFYDFMEKIR